MRASSLNHPSPCLLCVVNRVLCCDSGKCESNLCDFARMWKLTNDFVYFTSSSFKTRKRWNMQIRFSAGCPQDHRSTLSSTAWGNCLNYKYCPARVVLANGRIVDKENSLVNRPSAKINQWPDFLKLSRLSKFHRSSDRFSVGWDFRWWAIVI